MRKTIDDILDGIEGFMGQEDWRVNENSNAHYSYGALNKFITGEVSEEYWKQRVYTEEIRKSHNKGYFHIHDLAGLSLYCCGYSLKEIIDKGVRGISNIPTSTPAKHFGSLLAQIANLTTIYQNEILGAVAYSSFDTLTAPFVKKDKLSYEDVKQHMQQFIFQINSNSRMGSEPAFSNLTFDLTPSKDILNSYADIGGELQDFTYKDCQHEMDMINKAFYELMLEGDAEGNPFAYPIPTYNIHERFDWDNSNNDLLWEMAGKYGTPYFANFINSDMEPSEARSMCCRLRLDKRELLKRNGGLFGSGDKTGSIGVVTLNLPRLGYIAKQRYSIKESSIKELYLLIDKYMGMAKESLEIKRVYIDRIIEMGLLPAFKEYVGTTDNHFSTIGLVGMNEMCENLLGVGIETKEGHDFSVEVLKFMRERIADFQEETGNLYNLEATPAESTCFRLALKDRKEFGNDIITQIGDYNGESYYTNSCHLPVSKVKNITQLFDHQDELQIQFTGGTVIHNYLDNSVSGEKIKYVLRKLCEGYRVPYISFSPVHSICPIHGFLSGYHDNCPKCGEEVESYQRITGYIRQVSRFNLGKRAEFYDRRQLKI